MQTLHIYLDGVGLFGPGLCGWEQARKVLSGQEPFALAPTAIPPVDKLPAAERRRVGIPVKLSMATGLQAAQHAALDPADLATVFSSTEGDGDNTHAILETLASSDRALSPTRFHNSVHNAPSGYWGIATGCMLPSTSLTAYDATFGAGLLETTTQACSNGKSCLLMAYDTVFPEPLHSLRPIAHAMGVAMVLSPTRTPASMAQLSIAITQEAPTPMAIPELETLRRQIPVARSLPLLSLLAQGQSGTVVLEYLQDMQLAITVASASSPFTQGAQP